MHWFTCLNKHSTKKGGLSAFGECILVFGFAFLLVFFAFCSFTFAETSKVYLENYLRTGVRVNGGVIGNHSVDSITYVNVSSGITYYSDNNFAFFNSDSLAKDSFCTSISFPFTPSVDGFILINDIVDGTMTDLNVYYFSEGGPDDPGTDDPDDPVDPGPDVPSFDSSYFDKIIDLLYVLIFLEFVNFVFPLSRSWVKSLIGGKND